MSTTDDVTPNGALAVADPRTVATIMGAIDLTDRAGISTFGDGAQREVVGYVDKILSQTRNKDLGGGAGDILLDVIAKTKGLDPQDLQKTGFLAGLFTSAESRLKRFIGQFEDVSSQIERIVVGLEKHQDVLRRDIAMFDELHVHTRTAIETLQAHIEAGKAFAKVFREGRLVELKARADAAAAGSQAGAGLIEAQEFSDATQALARLENRIHYLRQALEIAIRDLPQIRILQASDETLIESLQATINLAIPTWKRKMIAILGLTRQAHALEANRAVIDATNEMIAQASDMTRTQAIEVERQAQRGIVDMETLEQTNRDLIATVQGVLDVQTEGRRKRAEAEKRMDAMTNELRTALLEMKPSEARP